MILTPTNGFFLTSVLLNTGPIFKIFTFLEMALKFVCSSSSAGGRDMKIEAAAVIKKILSNSIQLNPKFTRKIAQYFSHLW